MFLQVSKSFFQRALGIWACCMLFFGTPPSIHAQKFEAGIFIGGANYLGDLADQTIELNQTRIGIGAVARYNISRFLAVRANLYNGKISGSDVLAGDPNLRTRGYAFSGSLQEVSLNVEYTFLGKRGDKMGFFKPYINPYVSLGIGVATCAAKPTAPANTVPYPFPEPNDVDNFLAIPACIGIRAHLSEYFAINVEFGQRSIFSDYLDGISVRGNPNKDDWYVFGGVGLIYTIPDWTE